MHITKTDILHLMQIFLPITLILILLLTPKDAVGCGAFGALLGAQTTIVNDVCRAVELPWVLQIYQNAAGDAGATGWWGAAFVILLLFLDKDFRRTPRKALDALAEAGITVSSLYLMFLAVTVIDVCLNFTGLSKFVAVDILGILLSFDLGSGNAAFYQFIALLITMFLAILLGMGMPAVPAYINVALLMGPLLIGLGTATFTAHMFIFYFAVASAITPPVALAAFAASTITKAEPMATGFSAVRSGIVMFFIPFVFAFYPELLLIDQALIDPQSPDKAFLPGYENGVEFVPLMWLLAKLVLALFLIASALARFDMYRLTMPWVVARLVVAVALLMKPEVIHLPALGLAIGLIVLHRLTARQSQMS